MRTLLTISLCALVLGGCAAPSTLLVNNQGQVGRCAAAGWGLAGASLAMMAQSRCVEDAERLGFAPLAPGAPVAAAPRAVVPVVVPAGEADWRICGTAGASC